MRLAGHLKRARESMAGGGEEQDHMMAAVATSGRANIIIHFPTLPPTSIILAACSWQRHGTQLLVCVQRAQGVRDTEEG